MAEEGPTAPTSVDTEKARALYREIHAALAGKDMAESVVALILMISSAAIQGAETREEALSLAGEWCEDILTSVRDNWKPAKLRSH